MIDGKEVLGVIPARGGSKRCPRKNILPYKGKPLILWTIEAASKSALLDGFIVSTDDIEIMQIVTEHSAIIERPDHLATDSATNEDVLRHACTLFDHEWIVLLQPTSPLRTGADIDNAILLARDSRYGTCISYNETGKKNGAVYVCKRDWLLDGKSFGMYYAEPYYMPSHRSLDIDYPDDFNG